MSMAEGKGKRDFLRSERKTQKNAKANRAKV